MHYRKGAFALDKSKPTIIPFERVTQMGQRKGEKIFYLIRFILNSYLNRNDGG